MYEKLAGFDGAVLYIDDEFIVHRVFNMKTGGNLTAFANVYSRVSSNQVHTQIAVVNQAESNNRFLKSLRSGMSLLEAEYALGDTVNTMAVTYFYKQDVDKKVVGVGKSDPANPLSFFSLRTSFTVVYKQGTDFSQYSVIINGDTVNTLNLDQMLNNSEPVPTSTSSGTSGGSSGTSGGSSGTSGSSGKADPDPIWFIGILLVLVILSVSWFVYSRSKGPAEEEEEGIYKTV